ncbi:DUF4265 domain-containing protein [Microbacterium testaceum]|uniref:DUF4265 domain-containing protein n=1 Tax=Microbacterium testaceum TaxID=2033 RepID=UPI00343CD0C3
MKAEVNYRTHALPVWRDRADALIQAQLEEKNESEQLWCRALGDDKFEVCCIPFYLYNVALGDIILASDHHFQGVVVPSGRYVFRVFMREEQYGVRESLVAELDKVSALTEWYSPGLISIDAPDLEKAKTISTWLLEGEHRGLLSYETGKL